MGKYLLVTVGLVAVIVGLVVVVGGRKPPVVSSGRVVVSTSFYPLYYFASVVGGSRAEVVNITPAGVEPHDFEPTNGDIVRIEKGNLLVLNGGVEAWGNKVKGMVAGSGVKVVMAGEGLFSQNVIEGGQSVLDPHVWLSPQLAEVEVGRIVDGLSAVDPGGKMTYLVNGQKLGEQLTELDREYRAGLSNCQQREMVTAHAAFGYLAKAYGLRQVAVAGLSPDSEPSAADLAAIVNLARRENLKFIFFEKLVSPKLAEVIASEVGAKTLVLDPIEGLTKDEAAAGENYLTIMQQNLANLELALGCKR